MFAEVVNLKLWLDMHENDGTLGTVVLIKKAKQTKELAHKSI